ncbi:equilibrative nucleotide transporter 1-like [Momordica charantia]|uniref:Equilibrative nucleotide transporter 1-like n=1 Tax=Momordica charantia TaxID=3673 RepID=A0A6J1DE53_MOMCH|nr:equilibrative nucleotide transporter 1-like [Momordica charantia]
MFGVGDVHVQSGVIGCAGELPERYMQAVVSGNAGSGITVSVLRMVTKGIYPQDTNGLRKSTILSFSVGISIIIVCIILYNAAAKLPVLKYRLNLNNEEKQRKGCVFGSISISTLWEILTTIKLVAFGEVIIFVVSVSIFPGYVTEDVHSEILKDWYPITLISWYYASSLIGKYFASVYVIKNPKITVGSCVARVLFYPLFIECLNGPQFLRTEIPVSLLTCLLGLRGGYLDAVCMISAPKMVPFEHAEVAGILMAISMVSGLAIGSVLAWFWVI